jgi:hypothetical protein
LDLPENVWKGLEKAGVFLTCSFENLRTLDRHVHVQLELLQHELESWGHGIFEPDQLADPVMDEHLDVAISYDADNRTCINDTIKEPTGLVPQTACFHCADYHHPEDQLEA